MIRALLFVVLLGVIVWISIWFAENPGTVSVHWRGYRYDTSVGVVAVALTLLVGVAAIAYRFWRFLRQAPRAVVDAARGGRRGRGYRALAQGMAAVAAGDAAEAARLARRADNLLNDPALTLPLRAQAAQLNGDPATARQHYEAMLDNAETAFLGVRGLLRLARESGDTEAALKLARKAYSLRADAPWVLTNLFQLQVAARQWDEALKSLDLAIKRKAFDPETGRRHRAALLLERSRQRETAGDRTGALDDARKAAELAPALAPAAAAAVRLLAAVGKERRAVKLSQRVWGLTPHAELAAAYLGAGGNETPLARYRRAERLAATNPEHPESHVLMADAALKAELWGEARRHLERAMAGTSAPSARICRLMAAIERFEHGNMAAAQYWLERASVAPAAPGWVCDACGASADAWTSICGHCGAFDSFAWQLPPRVMPVAGGEAELIAQPLPVPSGVEPRAGGRGISEVEVDTIPPLPVPPDVEPVAAASPTAGARVDSGDAGSEEAPAQPEREGEVADETTEPRGSAGEARA
jgi:HemY protein